MRIICAPSPQLFFVYIIYKDQDVQWYVQIGSEEFRPPKDKLPTDRMAVFEIAVSQPRGYVELRGKGQIYAVLFSWYRETITQEFINTFSDQDLMSINDGALIIRV